MPPTGRVIGADFPTKAAPGGGASPWFGLVEVISGPMTKLSSAGVLAGTSCDCSAQRAGVCRSGRSDPHAAVGAALALHLGCCFCYFCTIDEPVSPGVIPMSAGWHSSTFVSLLVVEYQFVGKAMSGD